VKVGDPVSPGMAIAEIETDKASMAFEAQDDMIVAKFLVEEGQEVAVGAPIFVSVEKAGDVGAFSSFQAPAVVAAPAQAKPVAAKAVAVPAAAPAAKAATPAATPAAAPVVARASGTRVFASPLARKLARDAGVDLSALRGTGPNGRIVAADVKNAPAASSHAAIAAATRAAGGVANVTSGVGSTGAYADFELSELALGVAARYTHAKQVVPHYYLSIDLNLTKMLQMRKDLGGDMDTTNFFLKAVAGAMKEVPDVNGAWMDSFVRRYEQVDINLIMGSGAGLLTPVIRDVGGKGLRELSNELSALEDSLFADAQGSKVASTAELAPGTFSIHDLGMFGVKAAAPIVLPPQACALALGTITDTVVPHASTKWAVAPVMTATLSVDHRVVDGAVAAQWLSAFKTLIENPVGLML